MKDHRPYELQEYDPQWKELFLSASEKLKLILGDNLISIEHIGSTSIKDMVAKPQIDILAVVKDLELVKNSYESFKEANFVPHGQGYVRMGDEYVSQDAPDGHRVLSIHILQDRDPKIFEYRIFRDYLNENQQDRDLYVATKRRLYSEYHDSYAKYDSGKKEVIDAIKQRAAEWASQTYQIAS